MSADCAVGVSTHAEGLKLEIQAIDAELKKWFLARRVQMERNLTLKNIFAKKNVAGPNEVPPSATPLQRQLWKDLTSGRPTIEGSIADAAKAAKSKMYMTLFKKATDLNHPCRGSGTELLQCLQNNALHQYVDAKCSVTFDAFSACREALFESEKASLRATYEKQALEDVKARDLWIKRTHLAQQLKTCT